MSTATMHVVAGVDGGSTAGGSTAGAVLRQAGVLARRLDARLDVVHVMDTDDVAAIVPRGVGAAPAILDPQVKCGLTEVSRDLEQEAERELAGFEIDWVFHRREEGDPGRALAELAEAVEAYCIVVGTRGEGFRAYLERLVRPAVPHALIRDWHRPVFVVPGAEPPMTPNDPMTDGG